MYSLLRAAQRAVLLGALVAAPSALAADDDHGPENESHEGEGHAEGEPEAPRRFTEAEMAEAGIVVAPVATQPLPRLMRVPGEVRVNGYTSSLVSPRVSGVVITRHVRLGDRVTAGQPLLRLFSAGMAEAQSAFVLAHQEYARLTGVGRAAVSRKETDQAFIALQEARVRLQTYGLTDADLAALERNGLTGGRIGEFDLNAPQAGVIVAESFRAGEVVEAGRSVAEIGDGVTVWIAAMASPSIAAAMDGTEADFAVDGETHPATVLHVSPVLSENTRTAEVRLETPNLEGRLRPGTFVDVRLYGARDPVVAVPTEAVLRTSDGDWAVQVEHEPGVFEPQEVEILYAVGDLTAIEGLKEGTRIAVKGAFFIAAEAAKSGFDTHAH